MHQLLPSVLNADSFISIHKASPPFFSLATKPKLNEYFICVWLMEHSGSSPLGTLHNGVLTASQRNILSLSKRDVCLPVEPTHYYCLVSPVPVFSSRAGPPATVICRHCAPGSKPRRLAQLQAGFFPLYFEVCLSLSLMWGRECLQSFSFKDTQTGISNQTIDYHKNKYNIVKMRSLILMKTRPPYTFISSEILDLESTWLIEKVITEWHLTKCLSSYLLTLKTSSVTEGYHKHNTIPIKTSTKSSQTDRPRLFHLQQRTV